MPNETEHPSQKVSKSVGGCGMSEKVRLPKEVCDALGLAKSFYSVESITYMSYRKQWSDDSLMILNKIDSLLVMRALVLGYEPELSAEEKAKELFFNCNENQFAGFDGPYTIVYRLGIIDGLRTHGIHYDWMEDAK